MAVGAAVAAFVIGRPPAALGAATTCSTLLRAACERQQACPGCVPASVDCSRVVAEELPACVARSAPGETFSAATVGECQRAFLEQPCPLACSSFTDPPACEVLEGLSGGPR